MHVAVIGLGIAGSSIAAALARRGYRVTAIEQFSLLHDRGSSHGDTRIFRRYPHEGQEYERLAGICLPLWRQWNEEAGENLLVTCGGIDAGPAGSPMVERSRDICARHPSVENRMLSGEEVNRGFPLFRLPPDWQTVFQPTSGYLRPDATLKFLHQRARDAGAALRERFPAVIEATNQDVRVHGNGETIECDKVIVSAGGWLPSLLPELALPLSVERRVMGWFRLRDGRKLNPGELPIFILDDAGAWYGMPTPDGCLKFGNHSHLREKIDSRQAVGEPDKKDEQLLASGASRYLNGFEEEPFRMKTCIYTINQGDRFIMDWHPDHPNVLIFSCCSGHGFKYGPAYGEIAVEMIEGKSPACAQLFALKPKPSAS